MFKLFSKATEAKTLDTIQRSAWGEIRRYLVAFHRDKGRASIAAELMLIDHTDYDAMEAWYEKHKEYIFSEWVFRFVDAHKNKAYPMYPVCIGKYNG